MTILQRIMEELNIREVHEIPTALTKALLDSNACSALLKAIQPYYSYEALLNISAHDIKHMEILCHTDVETQALISMMFQSMHGTSLSAQHGRFFNA